MKGGRILVIATISLILSTLITFGFSSSLFSKTKIPVSYLECFLLNLGKDRDYECTWRYTLPLIQDCSSGGCVNKVNVDPKFKNCERKGGSVYIPIVLTTGSGGIQSELGNEKKVICALSFFNKNYKFPKDYSSCTKSSFSSAASGSATGNQCILNYYNDGAYSDPQNTTVFADLASECQKKGGKVIKEENSKNLILYPANITSGEVGLRPKTNVSTRCTLIYQNGVPFGSFTPSN